MGKWATSRTRIGRRGVASLGPLGLALSLVVGVAVELGVLLTLGVGMMVMAGVRVV